MQDYLIHDQTGRIYVKARMPEKMIDQQVVPAGHSLLLVTCDMDTDWVTGGELQPRPVNSTTLNGMKLTNVPAGATVTIEGTDYTVTDGTADLSFSQPGTYTVTVSAFPMLDATFEVTQV
jgi:hypothetical protein